MKQMAADARAEAEALRARVEALEAALKGRD
jgi:BMFP domain-containing protein YqiC